MSPVIRELSERGIPFYTIHSGQHYSPNMSGDFFTELEIPTPTYNSYAGRLAFPPAQVAGMVYEISSFLNDKADHVIVHGDTNTTLACALAANKLGIPISHIEAGLRCGDRSMPEEMNRVLVDQMATYWFPPTTTARGNILIERLDINRRNISQATGNTVVDAMHHAGFDNPTTKRNDLVLLTLHRQENVDDKNKLFRLLKAVSDFAKRYEIPVMFPIHPRTRKRVGEREFPLVGFVDPLGYRDFLSRERESSLIITDSGGVVEEACTLRTPCVILRDCTERPEAIACGAASLANADTLSQVAEEMLSNPRTWDNLFGDGNAAKRIIDFMEQREIV